MISSVLLQSSDDEAAPEKKPKKPKSRRNSSEASEKMDMDKNEAEPKKSSLQENLLLKVREFMNIFYFYEQVTNDKSIIRMFGVGTLKFYSDCFSNFFVRFIAMKRKRQRRRRKTLSCYRNC